MIIVKTPMRMSFVGGGTDLPDFYTKHGGAVVSAAINKYVYVTVNPKFDQALRVSYSKTEEVSHTREVQHALVRACLQHVGIEGGLEITSIADVPSRGTGLGSSSSFTVGLLQALFAYVGRYIPAMELAELASRIEIDICGEPIGKQDQYAAAFGGFNFVEFFPDGRTRVDPIVCTKDFAERLQQSLLVLYTGLTRSASDVLVRQMNDVRQGGKEKVLVRMMELAHGFRRELQNNNMDAVGEYLHENWELKRATSSAVSNPEIDRWYAAARALGATGGKILGAGGGGFLLLTAPPDRHDAIIHALPDLRKMAVQFERNGSQIIFYH